MQALLVLNDAGQVAFIAQFEAHIELAFCF
jgi:hypothetical protein